MSDKILVIDLEATCWEDKEKTAQNAEIIEIGVVVFNKKTCLIENKESILVQPSRTEISPFCTELTSLKPIDFENAFSLKEAFQILNDKFLSKNTAWASWGDWDRTMLEREAVQKGLSYPMHKTHFNVKAMFNLFSKSQKKSLPDALKKCGLTFSGRLHRGHDDAYAIAQILQHLIINCQLP